MPIAISGRNHRRGFTLIELLVVIGIIVVLIGILLPTIARVRQAAYVADTQAELTMISNACHQYYLDANAFPGPFSNDQIENGSTPPMMTPPAGGPAYSNAVTMPQNLTLGLLGELTIYSSTNTITANTFYLDVASIGQGPLSLNSLNQQRKSPYISNVQGILSGIPFTDSAGNKAGDNTGIPVFIDRFPGSALPILYLRARFGGAGIVAKGQIDINGTACKPRLQYDLNQIKAYTSATIGSPSYSNNGSTGHGLKDVGKFLNASGNPSSVSVEYPANAGVYFRDNSFAAAAPDRNIQVTGRPRQVDEFILISAGKDGTYGSPDDITNFGDVTQ